MPRPVPVDLILHSLAELLAEHPDDSVPGLYAAHVARCVDHRRLAEEWTCGAGVEQHARWFVRRLSGDDMGLSADHPVVSGETRAIEVTLARRLADHAFASLVEQDAAATARATTLLRAAQAVAGLSPAPPAQPPVWRTQTINLLDGEYVDGARLEERDGRWRVVYDLVTIAEGDSRTAVEREALGAIRRYLASRGLPTPEKTARQFKVGDRVRYARAAGPEAGHRDCPPIGWTGEVVVEDARSDSLYVMGVDDGGGSLSWWLDPDALDLLVDPEKAKRPFKVGDYVRYARAVGPDVHHRHCPPIGWYGLITADDGAAAAPLKVDGRGCAWWFAPEALDLVTPAPA